jgi:hypothetical protein
MESDCRNGEPVSASRCICTTVVSPKAVAARAGGRTAVKKKGKEEDISVITV